MEKFKTILDYILRPFRENLEMTVTLTLLSGAADGFFWTCHAFNDTNVNPVFGIYMLLHSFVLVYAIVLVSGLLSGKAFLTTKWILYSLGFLNLCVDTGVHIIMKCGFIQDFAAIILGTNVGETQEFLGMYLNKKMILFVITTLSIIGIITWRIKRINNRPKWFGLLGVITVSFCSLLLITKHSQNWDGIFLMKIKTCLSYKPAPELLSFRRKYHLSRDAFETPHEIVLIIGESLNKSHMSAYGYDKKNTPNIDSLIQEGNLFRYLNVTSSAIGTIPSFKCLMTSATISDQEDIVDKIFFADIAQSAGYKTTWVSNQSPSGVHDNVVARFAKLSDSTIWCGSKYSGITKSDLDGIVLEPLTELSEKSTGNSFTFVHLMGSHENFNSRFPQEFARFTPDDYPLSPTNQRQILADYDNSVLYNDWVVSSIIDIYKEKEAVIIYCPDHSLDIFDSAPDYAGHARPGDNTSVQAGKNIPFLIYISDSYRKNYPSMSEKIAHSIENKFETQDLMYTIMDLMGVDFADQEPCVSKYSLFRDDAN